ncbi:MAG: NAD(P)-binding domain-containing protein, partial [Armatimonadota bacterium]|nr:NAD(P)-binding domain-containing protein [Armatimonadota bacterium]
MGRPIARNLLQAGFPLIVFDVATKPVEELVSAGVTRGASV